MGINRQNDHCVAIVEIASGVNKHSHIEYRISNTQYPLSKILIFFIYQFVKFLDGRKSRIYNKQSNLIIIHNRALPDLERKE